MSLLYSKHISPNIFKSILSHIHICNSIVWTTIYLERQSKFFFILFFYKYFKIDLLWGCKWMQIKNCSSPTHFSIIIILKSIEGNLKEERDKKVSQKSILSLGCFVLCGFCFEVWNTNNNNRSKERAKMIDWCVACKL